MKNPVCVVIKENIPLTPEQENFIHSFGLGIVDQCPQTGLYLCFIKEQLHLCQVNSKATVVIDFSSGGAKHRRVYGGGELIGKAINVRKNKTVWDFTAGLGRDAFVLASLGLSVRLFEREPVVAAMLQDGITRALQDEETNKIAQNMTLNFADSLQQLTILQQIPRPDVVYLDPMYPETTKSAEVKKEMAYFHQLVGYNADDEDLLPLALSFARQRVVVKRPRLGKTLTDRKPDYQYVGKSTRFDVYVPDFPETRETTD